MHVKLKPDRLIKELFVWLAVDPDTGLEGICAFHIGETKAQAVSSNGELMRNMKEKIKHDPAAQGLHFKLVRYTKVETVESIP